MEGQDLMRLGVHWHTCCCTLWFWEKVGQSEAENKVSSKIHSSFIHVIVVCFFLLFLIDVSCNFVILLFQAYQRFQRQMFIRSFFFKCIQVYFNKCPRKSHGVSAVHCINLHLTKETRGGHFKVLQFFFSYEKKKTSPSLLSQTSNTRKLHPFSFPYTYSNICVRFFCDAPSRV